MQEERTGREVYIPLPCETFDPHGRADGRVRWVGSATGGVKNGNRKAMSERHACVHAKPTMLCAVHKHTVGSLLHLSGLVDFRRPIGLPVRGEGGAPSPRSRQSVSSCPSELCQRNILWVLRILWLCASSLQNSVGRRRCVGSSLSI